MSTYRYLKMRLVPLGCYAMELKCDYCRKMFNSNSSAGVGAMKDMDSQPLIAYYCGPCARKIAEEAANVGLNQEVK